MGSRGRTSMFRIGITDDDNDNLSNYATKGDGQAPGDLRETLQPNLTHHDEESPQRKAPGQLARTKEAYLSEDENDQGGHWKSRPKKPLIGSARVWFDKLPPESIDNYEMLRKAFLGNFSQQKKYIKDPVEIHHIKQREGESTEAFMEMFKAESIYVNEAPECMRISRFMHGITNPDLIKKLNDN
ncbi:reverse transcriptase domain-containing protein [Tanacetum coccineum]